MKKHFKSLFLLPTLIAGMALIPAGRVTAQTFRTLHSFAGSEEAFPAAALIVSSNTLYGTTSGALDSSGGMVFAINTNGMGFRNVHTFAAGARDSSGNLTNSDGSHPQGGLILSGGALYGTTRQGSSSGLGTVFAVNTDGTDFRTLYSFTGVTDGATPSAVLILSSNTLYGTTTDFDIYAFGKVFAVNTDGTGFRTLYSFTGGSDGGDEDTGLILWGNTLYGTTSGFHIHAFGTVFAVNTDGTGFSTLHSFTPTSDSYPFTNSDGATPEAGLILSSNTLYGTTQGGGAFGNGTMFSINTDGTGFRNLYTFPATGADSSGNLTNSNGAIPRGRLILSGNTLYGTAAFGGSSDSGTVFKVKTDGTSFDALYSFTARPSDYPNANSDGATPEFGLVLSNHVLYGTADSGGSWGIGTVFSLLLPTDLPQLTVIASGPNVILTWPTNYNGFTLQSTTNLGSAAGWTTNSPPPVVVNGQNTVTNPISGTQQFYRLSQSWP